MHYNSIFISDVHLGTNQCNVEYILKFFHDNTFNNVFLLGDIIDIEALSYKWNWKANHNTFIQKILKMSRHNVKVTYILGNHDRAFRQLIENNEEFSFGDIKLSNEDVYTTINNKKLILMHGDEFDGAFRSLGFLYFIGDRAYELSLFLNKIYNWFRKQFNMKYWSLSSYLKLLLMRLINLKN